MKKTENSLEKTVASGFLGAVIGAVMADDKEEGAIVGALIGAALGAMSEANRVAKQSNVPLYEVQEGRLYKISPGREREFIRDIERSNKTYPKKFKLN